MGVGALEIAPLMKHSHRHFRALMRILAPTSTIYTEMVSASAITRAVRDNNTSALFRLLGKTRHEGDVTLQLGSSNSEEVTVAAKKGEEYGYEEININCGCPSSNVQSGAFGAVLMKDPERVASMVRALKETTTLPVSVKCRIGVDDSDYDFLSRFIQCVVDGGVDKLVIHARHALLGVNISPKQNRTVPQLEYGWVTRVREEVSPRVPIIINGGIDSTSQAVHHIVEGKCDGVMLGRAAINHPYLIATIHQALLQRQDGIQPATTPESQQFAPASREEVVERYAHYLSDTLSSDDSELKHLQAIGGGRPSAKALASLGGRILQPLIHLYHKETGAKWFRKRLMAIDPKDVANIAEQLREIVQSQACPQQLGNQ